MIRPVLIRSRVFGLLVVLLIVAGLSGFGAGVYGLTDYRDVGTVEPGETVSVEIASDIVAFREARVAQPPVNATVNKSWESVTVETAQVPAIDPGDIWNLPLSVPDALFRDVAVVQTTDLELGTYVLFLWGCDSTDTIPENCRWLKPRVFTVAEFEEEPDPDPAPAGEQVGFQEESLDLPDSGVGDSITVQASLENTGADDFSGDLVVNLFDRDGNVVSSATQQVSVAGSTTRQVSGEVSLPDNAPAGACYAVEVRCPSCGRLSGLSGVLGSGIGFGACSSFYADITMSSSAGQEATESVNDQGEFPVSGWIENEGSVGAVVDVSQSTLSKSGDDADEEDPEEIAEEETLVYVGPTSTKHVEQRVPATDAALELGWAQTEIRCESDTCIESEPTTITRCVDAPTSTLQGLRMWTDGRSYVSSGPAWYSTPPSSAETHPVYPIQPKIRDDAVVLFEAPERIPEGVLDVTFQDEDGDVWDIYYEEYNWPGKRLISDDIDSHVDEGFDTHTVTFDWGCGTTELSFDVREECGDGEVFDGSSCVDQAQVMDLVGVPLFFEEEAYPKAVKEVQEGVPWYAQRSPFQEADVPAHRKIVTHFIEADHADEVDLEEPDTTGSENTCLDYTAPDLFNRLHTAANNDDVSGIWDKVVGISDQPVEGGRNGCGDITGKKAAVVLRGTNDTFWHEMGHTSGLCHNYGDSACDMSRIPNHPGNIQQLVSDAICANNDASDGEAATMNYCNGRAWFSGSPSAPGNGDEYSAMKTRFQNQNWLDPDGADLSTPGEANCAYKDGEQCRGSEHCRWMGERGVVTGCLPQ